MRTANILLASVLALSLAACGGDSKSSQSSTDETSQGPQQKNTETPIESADFEFINSSDQRVAFGDLINNPINNASEFTNLTYKSSNTEIAVVDTNGLVTTKVPGNVVISAAGSGDIQNYVASYNLEVEDARYTDSGTCASFTKPGSSITQLATTVFEIEFADNECVGRKQHSYITKEVPVEVSSSHSVLKLSAKATLVQEIDDTDLIAVNLTVTNSSDTNYCFVKLNDISLLTASNQLIAYEDVEYLNGTTKSNSYDSGEVITTNTCLQAKQSMHIHMTIYNLEGLYIGDINLTDKVRVAWMEVSDDLEHEYDFVDLDSMQWLSYENRFSSGLISFDLTSKYNQRLSNSYSRVYLYDDQGIVVSYQFLDSDRTNLRFGDTMKLYKDPYKNENLRKALINLNLDTYQDLLGYSGLSVADESLLYAHDDNSRNAYLNQRQNDQNLKLEKKFKQLR